MNYGRFRIMLLGGAALFAASVGDAAFAQSVPTGADVAGTAVPDRDAQEIIVTGSRLKRAITDTVEPTFIVDAKQIETRGYTDVADALRELPEFGPA